MTRRDNGQPAAASYAPLADVDPPLVDHVLALLDGAGIAAFAEPLAGETGPYRDVRAPDRPTTRVFVDRAELSHARDVVGRTLPALRADFLADAAAREDLRAATQADVDARWAQIVADFDAPLPDDPVPRWSVLEDVDPGTESDHGADRAQALGSDRAEGDRAEADREGTGSGLSSRLVRRTPSSSDDATAEGLEGQDGSDSGLAPDDPADHYSPPHPPPLPRPRDAVARFAWTGAVGGPLLIIAANVAGLEDWIAGLGVLAFVAGFVTLIARMKEHHDDDGWDDGAVV